MDINKVAEKSIVALLWLVVIVKSNDYIRRGVVHLKVGFVEGLPAVVLLGFLLFVAVLFTFWSFNRKPK